MRKVALVLCVVLLFLPVAPQAGTITIKEMPKEPWSATVEGCDIAEVLQRLDLTIVKVERPAFTGYEVVSGNTGKWYGFEFESSGCPIISFADKIERRLNNGETFNLYEFQSYETNSEIMVEDLTQPIKLVVNISSSSDDSTLYQAVGTDKALTLSGNLRFISFAGRNTYPINPNTIDKLSVNIFIYSHKLKLE